MRQRLKLYRVKAFRAYIVCLIKIVRSARVYHLCKVYNGSCFQVIISGGVLSLALIKI